MSVSLITTLVTAGASLIGSLAGCWAVSKLQVYRVDQLEKKVEKIDTLENTQITIQGELEVCNKNHLDNKENMKKLEDEVSKMKTEIQQLTTKVALIENEIKLYHK